GLGDARVGELEIEPGRHGDQRRRGGDRALLAQPAGDDEGEAAAGVLTGERPAPPVEPAVGREGAEHGLDVVPAHRVLVVGRVAVVDHETGAAQRVDLAGEPRPVARERAGDVGTAVEEHDQAVARPVLVEPDGTGAADHLVLDRVRLQHVPRGQRAAGLPQRLMGHGRGDRDAQHGARPRHHGVSDTTHHYLLSATRRAASLADAPSLTNPAGCGARSTRGGAGTLRACPTRSPPPPPYPSPRRDLSWSSSLCPRRPRPCMHGSPGRASWPRPSRPVSLRGAGTSRGSMRSWSPPGSASPPPPPRRPGPSSRPHPAWWSPPGPAAGSRPTSRWAR